MTTQSVSKLDAASRQLHLAIDLYFKDEDPLGIHTLGGSARQAIPPRDSPLQLIDPEPQVRATGIGRHLSARTRC